MDNGSKRRVQILLQQWILNIHAQSCLLRLSSRRGKAHIWRRKPRYCYDTGILSWRIYGVISLLVILRALVIDLANTLFIKTTDCDLYQIFRKNGPHFQIERWAVFIALLFFLGPCLFSYCFWTRVIVVTWIISDGNLSSNNSRSFESDFRLSNAPQATRSSRTCLCRRAQRKSTILVYWRITNNSLHWYRTSFSIA